MYCYLGFQDLQSYFPNGRWSTFNMPALQHETGKKVSWYLKVKLETLHFPSYQKETNPALMPWNTFLDKLSSCCCKVLPGKLVICWEFWKDFFSPEVNGWWQTPSINITSKRTIQSAFTWSKSTMEITTQSVKSIQSYK